VVLASVKASEGVGWPAALPLLPHPAEIIIGLIAFAILYRIFSKSVVPKMEAMYAERAAAIEGGMQEAEQAQAEAQAALEKYNAQLAEARTEANEIRESAREQGASIVAEMRAQAQAEAARISESAKRQVEAERQQAVVQLRQEVGTLSTTLAARSSASRSRTRCARRASSTGSSPISRPATSSPRRLPRRGRTPDARLVARFGHCGAGGARRRAGAGVVLGTARG
jgi:F-type H+-transporting ATPase subunit b